MLSLNPYFNFAGNTEQAFEFYKSVFGGDFTALQRFKDTPEAGNVAASEKNKIMHVSLPLGKCNTLMATDALESLGQKVTAGNNIAMTIEAETREEADRLYRSLSQGGRTEMPMQEMFWGAYYGMLTDQFGIQWMINYDLRRGNA